MRNDSMELNRRRKALSLDRVSRLKNYKSVDLSSKNGSFYG